MTRFCLLAWLGASALSGCGGEEPPVPASAPMPVSAPANRGPAPEQAAAVPPVRRSLPVSAVSLDQYRKAWQVDVNAAERPLGDVLAELLGLFRGWRPEILVAVVTPRPDEASPRPKPAAGQPSDDKSAAEDEPAGESSVESPVAAPAPPTARTPVVLQTEPLDIQWVKPNGTADLPAGLPAHLQPKAILARPVTLTLTGVSRFEAIERACAAAGVRPEYVLSDDDDDAQLRLFPLPIPTGGMAVDAETAPLPGVAFPGPFLVRLTELSEFAPTTTGRLRLQILAAGLPGPVREVSPQFPVKIEEVIGSDGTDLMGDVWYTFTGDHDKAGIIQDKQGRIELKNLLRGVTAIARIRGRVELAVPLEVKTVWFDRLEPGKGQQHDGLRVTLDTARLQGRTFSVRLSATCDPPLQQLGLHAFDEQGSLVKPLLSSSGSSGNKWTASATFSAQPASMAVVAVTRREKLEYPFELTEIPLRRHARQPEEQEPLRYPGHDVPLTLEVKDVLQENVFRKVLLHVVNHANKAAAEVDVMMEYLDADGKILEDHKTTIRGQIDFSQRGNAPVAEAGQTVKRLETAFFMPDEATQVRVTVKEIRFADATVWTPPE